MLKTHAVDSCCTLYSPAPPLPPQAVECRLSSSCPSLVVDSGAEGGHCIIHCTLHCIIHCTLHCIIHCTLHCSLQNIYNSTLYITLYKLDAGHWTLMPEHNKLDIADWTLNTTDRTLPTGYWTLQTLHYQLVILHYRLYTTNW